MSEDVPTESGGDANSLRPGGFSERLGSVSVDWWATAVGRRDRRVGGGQRASEDSVVIA